MQTEKVLKPVNGYFALVMTLVFGIAMVVLYTAKEPGWGAVCTILFFICSKGLIVVNPNSGKILQLFGKYVGSIKDSGIFWINPLYQRSNISLRARNFESDKVKVNDKLGNPIMISVILVWKVQETAKAFFEVDNYEKFIMTQTDSAVRKLAASYAYDHFEDERASVTLSTDFDEVNRSLEKEIAERLRTGDRPLHVEETAGNCGCGCP